MYHHWGCTSIKRTLSYPFRSLTITPSLQVKIKVHVQQDGNLEDDLQQPPSAPGKNKNTLYKITQAFVGYLWEGARLHNNKSKNKTDNKT